MAQEPTIKSLLQEVERDGRRLERLLRALDEALQKAESRGETAAIRDPMLGPEMPNGEGTIGLTESEVLQGRGSPPGCDPKGGEGLRSIFCNACKHKGGTLDTHCAVCGPPEYLCYEAAP
jgi:hypothetical protein